MIVTFDSNVWRPVSDPSRFPNDPMHSSFVKINNALASGQIKGRLSETVFTLEGIRRADRKNFIGSYKPKPTVTEEVLADGTIKLGFSLGPDKTAHPGNNSFLSSHLNDALSVGIELMRCHRVAGVQNCDLVDTWFAPPPAGLTAIEVANAFGEISREIEKNDAGIAHVKRIGATYVSPGQMWIDGLAAAPESQENAIASAVAEWADGDTVSAHFAYKNTYICTRDSAVSAGSNSVFSPQNRQWLESKYGVVFLSPDELAALV